MYHDVTVGLSVTRQQCIQRDGKHQHPPHQARMRMRMRHSPFLHFAP